MKSSICNFYSLHSGFIHAGHLAHFFRDHLQHLPAKYKCFNKPFNMIAVLDLISLQHKGLIVPFQCWDIKCNIF